MMAFNTCRALADDAARVNGDAITEPQGMCGDELFFYAVPADLQDADLPDGFAAVGLPYGYWVNMKTGAARICTGDESIKLLDREYLAGFEPVSE